MVTLPRSPRLAVARQPSLGQVLLSCEVVSSVLYVAADVIGTLRYPGYSWLDQEFSELTAQGAATRPLMLAVSEFPYTALVLAFAAELWSFSGPWQRAARVTSAGLAGYALFGFSAGTITPMNTREVLAAGEATTRNAFHGPLTLVSDLCLMLAMVVAGQLLGKRFRVYSYGTVITLLVFGVLASRQIGRMAADEPTPWMGLEERVNIYASMLWLALLALGLLRIEAPGSAPENRRALRPGRAREFRTP